MEEIKEVKKMVTNDEEKKKKVEANKASSKAPKKSTSTKNPATGNNKEKVEEATTKKATNKSTSNKITTKKATSSNGTTKKVANAKTASNKETASTKTDTKKAQTKKTSTSKATTKKNTSTKTTTSKTKNTENKTNKEASNKEEKIDKQPKQTTKKKNVETNPKKEEIEKKIEQEEKIIVKEEQMQEQKAEPIKQENIEENVAMEEEKIEPKENEEIKPKKKHSKMFVIFSILVIIAIMAFSTVFALMNKVSDKIIYGISIKGIDVSGLTMEQATDKMNNAFEEQWKKDITLKYEDFETVVTPEQIEMKFNVDEAVKLAYSIGRTGSILKDNYSIINANISKQDISVGYSYNEDALTDFITSTGGNLPNLVQQSSYSIDGSNLIIDKGQKGICIEEETLKKQIVQECSTLRRKSSYTDFNFRKGTRCNRFTKNKK